MLKSYLTILVLISTLVSFSQENNCFEKCNRSHMNNPYARANYYQYPSMDNYDVKYIKLDLNSESNSRIISGTCQTNIIATATLDSFITELKSNMTVDSVFLNGVKKSFSVGSDHVFIPVIPALSNGQSLSVLIYYKGTAGSSGVFAGTTGGGPGGTPLTYTATLSESYQAREWFPCKQILTDKLDSADIWVTTSSVNKVGSNGLLQGVDALPSGKVRYRWKSIHPMNYYMLSIAVGNYSEYLNYAHPEAIAPDSILIQHYIAGGTYINSVKTNLDKTPVFVEKMSELFGLYPFWDEKYGHAQANIGGGMEHQTMSTMASFGTSIIAHELGHQWFGDNVTCAKWNDIFVNEGFATYSEYLMMEKLPALFTTTNASTYMNSIHSSVMSVANGSVYIPDASVYDENRIFSSRLSYNKGAAIIHNLRFEMQSDTFFFKTLKQYQQQFKNSTATGEDLKTVAENICGRSFSDFFNQWYYGEGYPTHNITWYKPTSDSIVFLVNENVSAASVTPFFGGYLEIKATSSTGDTTFLVNLLGNNQIFRFSYSNTPTSIVIDPNNWIINKTGTITNATVVPVKFISFNGTADKNCWYDITWNTQNEINVREYIIEMSSDGSQFVNIGSQTPTFGINNVYTFRYEDATNVKCFFRIKVMKPDGTYTYSSTLELGSICEKPFNVSLNQNPININSEIKIQMPISEKGSIRLFSPSGQLLYIEEKILNRGINTIQPGFLQKLSAGTFYLRVETTSGFKGLVKLIKR